MDKQVFFFLNLLTSFFYENYICRMQRGVPIVGETTKLSVISRAAVICFCSENVNEFSVHE